MTVGNQPSVPQVNGQLSALAVNLRNDCQAVANFQQYVVSLGQSGLEALGFTTADAATVLTMASYLNTVAEVFEGTAAQPTQFNFSNATCELWAGQ